MCTADPVVAVAGLRKRYGGRDVVTDVTMIVNAGTVTGLVGANGGGKTTTLHLLAGLILPDGGEGVVLGRALGTAPDRARIGLMPQRCALYPELTMRENLMFRAAVHGVSDRVEQALATYGLAPVAASRVVTLSGGWSRRAEFAAAVLHAPRLLLLDEPTAGLDIATRERLWGWIAALAKGNVAVVISTHDLIEAEQCDTVILYRDGTASAQATPAALRHAHGYATLEEVVRSTAAS